MLRQLISTMLLILIFISAASYYPIFKAEQWFIRKEIKKRIKNKVPDTQLHHIEFKTDQLDKIDWTRLNREFRKDGEMFDIVKSDTFPDRIVFYCVNDTEEKILFNRLENLVSEEIEKGNMPVKRKAVSMIKLMSSLHYLSGDPIALVSATSSRVLYRSLKTGVTCGFKSQTIHPPDSTAVFSA